MRQSTENKILELFYERPKEQFTIRKISQITKIPRATAHKYLNTLKKQGLIDRENKAATNLLFKTKKINYFVEKIVESKLIDHIVDNLNPSCIILFGSVRKGDSVKDSDIDLFVETTVKKTIDTTPYEKKLKHKIQLFVEPDISKLQKHLYNNVINGIKIYGSLKVK